jgi:hypothetical protein
MIAAPVAVIAALPVPRSLNLGGVLSTGGMKAAAAVLLMVVVVAAEVVLLPVLLKALRQRPWMEQAARSGHQRSGDAHLH